VHATLDGFSA